MKMSKISRDTFLRLVQQMGQPPHLEQGPDYDAVFGPIEFEGRSYYRYYEASTFIWQVGLAIPQEERRVWQLTGHPDDRPEEVAAANALNFLPTPRQPENRELDSFKGPFWHAGRRFAWVLPKEENGWHLALSIMDDENDDVLACRLFDRSLCD